MSIVPRFIISILILFSFCFSAVAQDEGDSSQATESEVSQPADAGEAEAAPEAPSTEETPAVEEAAAEEKPKKRKKRRRRKRVAKSSSFNNQSSAKVEWYLPKVEESKSKKRKLVTLTGRISEPSIVYIPKRKIPILVKRKLKYYSTKKAFSKTNSRSKKKKYGVDTDDRGFFEITLSLPKYQVQLPLKVRTANKSSMNIVLKLNMSKDEDEILSKNLITPRLRKDKKISIWLGAGFNYLDYQQETTLPSDLKYASFKLPALYGKFEYHLNRQWDLSLEYTSAPGEAEEGDQPVDSTNYTWDIIDIGAYYTPRSFEQRKFFGPYYADYGFRFGAQMHSTPFLRRKDASTLTIDTKSLTFIALGPFVRMYSNSNIVYEAFLRYQQHIASDSTLEVSPSLAFDGSVGLYYLVSDSFRFGLFWYGQFQQYDFNGYEEEFSGGGTIDGSSSVLFSNIEARVGFEW